MITGLCEVCHFMVTRAQLRSRVPITRVGEIRHEHFVMCEIPAELLSAA
jgi:hypothetical protein